MDLKEVALAMSRETCFDGHSRGGKITKPLPLSMRRQKVPYNERHNEEKQTY